MRHFYKQLFLSNISNGCFRQFQVSSLQRYEKRDPSKDVSLCILQNFWEHLLTRLSRMTASCVFLWILRGFSEHLLYKVPLWSCLFHIQIADFQPADTVTSYLGGAFQAFYTRKKSTYSKKFIYLKSLKIICEVVHFRRSHPEVFLREVVRKICSTFTGEHLRQSEISIKLHIHGKNFQDYPEW